MIDISLRIVFSIKGKKCFGGIFENFLLVRKKSMIECLTYEFYLEWFIQDEYNWMQNRNNIIKTIQGIFLPAR